MSDCEENYDDLEILRQNNIKEKNAFLSQLTNDPLFSKTIKQINLTNQGTGHKPKEAPSSRSYTRKKGNDSSFKYRGAIVPNVRRSSARLQNKKPDFTHNDLPDEKLIVPDSNSIEDLEEVVYSPRRSRKPSIRASVQRIVPVEEVTEEMIENIQTSGNKVYGPGGTSCHQCRQKTVDTKTICRSGFCVGVRGQFCGICVINRYGEDPVQALKDPHWRCYVCRGCCNCSFCRAKQGKRPTGILTPLARMNGFKSVYDFLRSLNGYGDYTDLQKDPERLLGFDSNVAVLGEERVQLKCDYDDVHDRFVSEQ